MDKILKIENLIKKSRELKIVTPLILTCTCSEPIGYAKSGQKKSAGTTGSSAINGVTKLGVQLNKMTKNASKI